MLRLAVNRHAAHQPACPYHRRK